MQRQVWSRSLAGLLAATAFSVPGAATARGARIEVTAPAAGATVDEVSPEIKLAFRAAGSRNVDPVLLEVKLDGVMLQCRTSRDLAVCKSPFLLPGEHLVAAAAPDSAGHRIVAESRFTVPASLADRDKPTLGLYLPKERKIYSDQKTVQLTFDYEEVGGSGLDLASFELIYDGKPPAESCRADDSGAHCPVPAEPGLHRGMARIADRAGNVAEASFELEILPVAADHDPPQIVISGLDGNLQDHVFTSSLFEVTIMVSDSGSDIDDRFKVELDGSEDAIECDGFLLRVADCQATDLSAGRHVLRVTVADQAGNLAEAIAEFVIEPSPPGTVAEGDQKGPPPDGPPRISVLEPNREFEVSSHEVSFFASWNDPYNPTVIDRTSVRVELDGKEWPGDGIDRDHSLEDTLPPLPVGPHRLTIEVADYQGRSSRLDYDFEVYDTLGDKTPPLLAITEPTEGQELVASDHEFRFESEEEKRGSGVDGNSLFVEIDGIDMTLYCPYVSFCEHIELPDGKHRMVVRVKDQQGNEAVARRRFSTLREPRDDYGPYLSFASPSEEPVHGDKSPPILLKYSDRSGADLGSLRLWLDGKRLRGSCRLGPEQASCTLPALEFGKHRLKAEIRDLKGFRGQTSQDFFLAPVSLPDLEPVDCLPGSGRYPPEGVVSWLREDPLPACFCPPALDCGC